MKAKTWTDKVQWAGSVVTAAAIIIGVIWTYSIKPTLANDFVTIQDFEKETEVIEQKFERLEKKDTEILTKIDKVSDKIDTIYQLLIEIK